MWPEKKIKGELASFLLRVSIRKECKKGKFIRGKVISDSSDQDDGKVYTNKKENLKKAAKRLFKSRYEPGKIVEIYLYEKKKKLIPGEDFPID